MTTSMPLLGVLLMLVIGVLFVRSGLRRPDTERRWVVGARWPVVGLVCCFGSAAVSGVLGGATGYDALGPLLVATIVAPVLLLVGLAAVWRRPSRGGATSYYRRALAPAIIVVLSIGALPTLVVYTVATTGQDFKEAPVVALGLLVAVCLFAAGVLTLQRHGRHSLRLVISEDGLEYARDRHRVLRLQWHQVARIEQQALGSSGPPALLVWLAHSAAVSQHDWFGSLWRPQLGAYAIDLRALGVDPRQLAAALGEHAAGRLASPDTPPPPTATA